ncbi:MAG: GGDEF domain-containing protein [Proteobacteria bacterium]|nr:GGDEF domain-containing protein [Pseudomonadota bacterium]
MSAPSREKPLGPKRRGGKILSRIAEGMSTLRFMILGLVVVSVLVPSFFSWLLASNRINNILRERVYRDIELKNQRIAEQVLDWIETRADDVQNFALTSLLLQEEVKNLSGPGAHGEDGHSVSNLESYLSYLLEGSTFFDAMAILSPEGEILASQPSGENFILPPESLGVLGAGPVIREIMETGNSRLAVAQRLDFTGGAKSAVFCARIGENLLKKTIRELSPDDSTVYLIDLEGSIKVSTLDLPPGRKAPPEAVALLHGPEKHAFFRGLEGKHVIATSDFLKTLSWGIVLETSLKSAFSPLGVFRFQMLLMALVLSGLLLVPALFFARGIVLPLEELSRVSRNIRSGKPGVQVQSKVRGELGEFIATFNSMSTSLQESLEEIKSTNETLLQMSITDPLTGRYNRRYIRDYLNRELQLVARTRHPLTILMIDLDNFKKYNDTYGHIAGDEALRQCGEILLGSVRQSDVVGRFGGEEWIVCLNYTDKEAGSTTAEKIRKIIAGNIFHLRGENTRITVSIGVATAPSDGIDYTEIIDAADSALYRAKEAGRDCVRVFSAPAPS